MTSLIQSAQSPGMPPPASNAVSSLTPATLGKEDFLKLLIAQLAHQDPMSPTDPTQFVSQLSQFSSLEQLTNIKSGLDLLAVTQTAGTSAQMVTFIGKSVAFNDQSVVWTDQSTPVTSTFELGKNAADVSIEVTDAQGRVVDTRPIGALGSGRHTFTFDGKKLDGTALPAGTYTLKITATTESGDAVTVTQRSQGVVTGITFAAGYPQLVLADGRTIGLAQISEVLAGETTPATSTSSTSTATTTLPAADDAAIPSP